MCFCGGSKVKNLPAMQETQVLFLGREDPLEKGMATHSSILAWRILWARTLMGYRPWDYKVSDTTEWLILSPTMVTVCNKKTEDSKCLSSVCHVLSTPIKPGEIWGETVVQGILGGSAETSYYHQVSILTH